ncbi:hypothetical protein F383_30924 [Gossypium arboreum]|uniref:Uncharacterized protein n=1 Tax=Gossypium arboreum TaxID=29729 RepID=A0A0B0N1R4_GOSAR|nr:hypothetical protein F383_30924 [Gossypium arboreum]
MNEYMKCVSNSGTLEVYIKLKMKSKYIEI